jgi:N-acetylglucosamine-6-phosphate deacetylase
MISEQRGRGAGRTVLSGADLILPDRVISRGTIVLEDGRISEIREDVNVASGTAIDCTGHIIVPGFIDVHVHGLEGRDVLDDGQAIGEIAARLPRYGVTAFCPTSLACAPAPLRVMLTAIGAARESATGARVLPAHLESNFISPDYRGAQPLECLRGPREMVRDGDFAAGDILAEIHAAQENVGIMTIAPELDGAIELIEDVVARGIHVSLGHSGASYDEARRGIAAGARQATHLFNRMTPLSHRAPGLTAAILESDEVTAEIICDGVHVHHAMLRVAVAAKGPSRIMAITDGTAGAGLEPGVRSSIGGRPITIREVAYLDDGTIAGSVLTMDRVLRNLMNDLRMSLPDAVRCCATTPADALGLRNTGRIGRDCAADLAILDSGFEVAATYIAGERVWTSPSAASFRER